MTVEEPQQITNGLEAQVEQQPQQPQQPQQQQQQQQQRKRDKNKRKKERKKVSRQQRTSQSQPSKQQQQSGIQQQEDSDDDIEVEYVFEDPPELTDVRFRHFRKIFQAFRPISEDAVAGSGGGSGDSRAGGRSGDAGVGGVAGDDIGAGGFGSQPNLSMLKARTAMLQQEAEDDEEADEGGGEHGRGGQSEEDVQKLSKRKLKRLTRLTVAELKQIVERPEVVEMHDICAKDPKLLCHLKAYRNAVQVPRHWCAKRKYLQGKRGIEKPPFQLPDFIKATGIMEMRDTVQEKEDAKTMKQKMRERVRPKVGKIDIDYQKLHDAFFKFQTKPSLTTHGDLYYEGREFETRLRAKKPGALSDELRTALGMPVGPGSEKYPPPWLIAMQRYGPPPAFPNLKIPGLNAPIPDGCSFGYHAGGWGKPPVDAHGRPIYGDVFGYAQQQQQQQQYQLTNGAGVPPGERNLWGELESESSESEADESDSDDDEGEAGGSDVDEEGANGEEGGPALLGTSGLVTPSGALSSATPMTGLETPDAIELRKQRSLAAAVEASMEVDEEPAAYRVLPEMTASVGQAFLGSAKVYDLSGAGASSSGGGVLSSSGTASGAASGANSTASRKRPKAQGGSASQHQQQQQQQAASSVSAAKKYAKDYKF